MKSGQERLLGIIGGMSWQSTSTYYSEINQRYNAALGGHHSAPVLLHSVDFAPIEAMQRRGDWDEAARTLAEAARGLVRAGAGLMMLATNTMHLVFDQLTAVTPGSSWIHIADPTGSALRTAGHRTVGLLGTRFTMEETFYRERLEREYGLKVLVPPPERRAEIDRVIFQELVHGEIREESRDFYRRCIGDLQAAGSSAAAGAAAEATAVILGCTEIGLLISAADSPLPLFDTTILHVDAAVEWLLNGGPSE